MNKRKLTSPLLKKDSHAPLISVVLGLLTGSAIILAVTVSDAEISLKSGLEAVKLVLFGVFATGRDASGELAFNLNGSNMGDLLFRAVPVIMTGLSVAFSFKAGLFNIGAPGQYLIGATFTLITALSLPGSLPRWFVWLCAFFCGMVAGTFWGVIPGLFKAYLNINEVICGIMTNWIAANAVTLIFEESPLRNTVQSGKIGYIMPTAMKGVATAKLGLDRLFPSSQINAGIIVAILFAIGIYVLLSKTTLGFEIKICGSNKAAAEYVGINHKAITVFSLAFSGALAAAGASLYYLAGHTEFVWSAYQNLPKDGFNGIPVALLASNNPVAIIFTSLFMSALSVAGQQIKNLTAFNEFITDIVVAVILYLSAFSFFIGQRLKERRKAD